MRFLNKILERPSEERPFLLLIAGFAEEKAMVPDIARLDLAEIMTTIS